MAYLYKNTNGYEVKSHSYSGGLDWSCPKKYYWKRIEGWQSKDDKVAFSFGHCVEDAVRYYHGKNFEPNSGVEEFKKLWFGCKNEDLIYTEKTGNWDDHYKMGSDLLRLYELTLPDLPLANARFQVEFTPRLFNEGIYEGLRYKSIIDMICKAEAKHPALPQVGLSGVIDFIVDIKTSASQYYVDPRLSALDAQLRDYAWVTGIGMVSFLVLVKNFSGIETGDWVTVLTGDKAGKKYQVFEVSGNSLLLVTKTLYDEYRDRKKAIKGKGSREATEVLQTEYFYKALRVGVSDVTKQRIQFLPAYITPEDAAEARREAIHEAMDIADHARENYYPKHPGVRFPNNVCTNCECLGLCIGDGDMVKDKLVQIGAEF